MQRAEPTELNAADMTAVAARAAIGRGDLSPVALLEDCIARVELLDPVVNALVTPAFERARTEARAAAAAVRAGASLGPLHGLPVAIKDIQATQGIATTYGSVALRHNVPKSDAGIVARIRRAGGIVIGKTNVPEMSIGANTVNPLFGATGNPFEPSLTCGGSSGGSAVALATRMVALATGSDHGGSLRIPACYSGVVGVRPTPGVVPNEQRRVPQTYYSVQGPMARNVADAALLLSVIAQRDGGVGFDPMAFPLEAGAFADLARVQAKNLRVAISADLGGVLVSQEVRAKFAQRMNKLAPHVHSLEQCSIDLRAAPSVDWHLRQDLFVAQYQLEAAQWDANINPNVRATYESALATPMQDIAAARRTQMQLVGEFAAQFARFDLIIVPGVSVPPFPWRTLNPEQIDGAPVENYMAWLALTAAITVVGHPVVALPCGTDDSGLPFGIQVIGRMYGDRDLLSAAAALEAVFAQDPELAAPTPDFVSLAIADAQCRTLGRSVQAQVRAKAKVKVKE